MKRGRRRRGMSAFTAGSIGIVVVVLLTYLAFTKFANPLASPFTVHAIFSSASGLRPDSLVRIAGVNVGKVQSISGVPGCTAVAQNRSRCAAADVTMTIDEQGLPLHTNATFRIRPRIFLEGNFFVDVSPGTPRGPAGAGRLHVPDPARCRAGSARSDPDLAAGRHPPQPADPPAAVRHGCQAGRPRV